MSVYMILDVVEVIDKEAYAQYREKVPPIVEKFGGRYLVRGGEIKAVIGDWKPGRIIVLEFPSHEHIQKWFNSPEYAPLAAIREKATKARGIIVEGSVD